MARQPASPLQLLQEMLSPENDVRRVAEVKYEDWLEQDPDACAAGLLGLCCDVSAGGARLLAFTLLRRVVATRWPGVAVDIRRGAAEAMLAQAFGTTGPSAKAAVENCAALVQQGLGLDDADEDANTIIAPPPASRKVWRPCMPISSNVSKLSTTKAGDATTKCLTPWLGNVSKTWSVYGLSQGSGPSLD